MEVHCEECERNTLKDWSHEICKCRCHMIMEQDKGGYPDLVAREIPDWLFTTIQAIIANRMYSKKQKVQFIIDELGHLGLLKTGQERLS